MTANEEKVLKIIKTFGGKAHCLRIAKEFKVSSEYTLLILQNLQRKKKIEFSGRWAFLPKRRLEKEELAEKKAKTVPSGSFSFKGVSKELQDRLQKAGYKNLEDLANVPISRLMTDMGLEVKQAANLINEARRNLKIIPNIAWGKDDDQ